MQYLYLLRAGNYYKVGIAANVKSRVSGLQSHNPELVEIVTTKLIDNAYEVEQAIHASLADMKAKGANEWFQLTPEQVIALSITIHKYPDFDVSEKVTLAGIVAQQRRIQRTIDSKLDYVINTYQKNFRSQIMQELPAKPSVVPSPKPERATKSSKPAPPPRPSQDDRDRLDQDLALEVFMLEHGTASTSLLQRRLSWGYGRAARIMDQLESQSRITHPDGNRPRQLITKQ